MRTYLDLSFGLMSDGHVLCFVYGLVFLAMPVLMVSLTVGMLLTETRPGLALCVRALDLLSRYRVLWPIGDALCRVVPREVAHRHQSRAHYAALWLEAYEDRCDHLPYERLSAAKARALLALPWV